MEWDKRCLPVLADGIRALIGDRLSTSAQVCAHHARGEGLPDAFPPDMVAHVRHRDEVAAIARLCDRHGVPMVAFGAGTSLEGHVTAPFGGVCINFTGMNRIVAVHGEDATCTVEPGVTRRQLNRHLADLGLFFPVDPGADATIGGMVATRASGTNAVRYGTMRENTLGLEVVTADGTVFRTGGRVRKSAAGYDLTHLFTGSEGTLGLVTQITLKLHGLPEHAAAASCYFPSLRDAVLTVSELIQCGVGLARVELLDHVQMRAVNRYSKLSLPEQPTLFLEFHGSPAGVAEQAELTGALVQGRGGSGFQWATQEQARQVLWRARHDAYFAALALRPGCFSLTTDVCVPISRLADCLLATREDIDAQGLLATMVGHVGDGNFHVLFLLDRENEEEMDQAAAINDLMVRRALAMGGTCTGEHGIGLGKREKLLWEFGPETLAVMKSIKKTLDPKGILNPGKLFL